MATREATEFKRPGVAWLPYEYDRIAAHALSSLPPSTDRYELLRIGQQVLPKRRQKPKAALLALCKGNLTGKAAQGFTKAVERVLKLDASERERLVNASPGAFPPDPLVVRGMRAPSAIERRDESAARAAVVLAEDSPQLTTRGTPKLTPAQRLVQLQSAAAKARAVKARMIAEGHKPDRKAGKLRAKGGVGGRVRDMLDSMDKQPRDLADAIGISLHSVNALFHSPLRTLRNVNLESAAKFLGVTYEWLKDGVGPGVDIDKGGPLVMPQAQQVFKANGKHHVRAAHPGKLDAAMGGHLDAAMGQLWGIMPMDVKAFLIARMSELVAMQHRKQNS